MPKLLILICNDDGIDAKGIHALACALDGLGEIVVIAPEREQSAAGHSITMRDPVRAFSYAFELPSGPVKAFAVTGTPADCIKLGCNRLLPRFPDLVFSGINSGPNTAVNILYSGTVSAASEACILGIPAVAVSLCSWEEGADFEPAGLYARAIAERVIEKGLKALFCYLNPSKINRETIQIIKEMSNFLIRKVETQLKYSK